MSVSSCHFLSYLCVVTTSLILCAPWRAAAGAAKTTATTPAPTQKPTQVCPYNSAMLPNGTCLLCTVWQYPSNGTCVSYSSQSQKLAGDNSAVINTGNTAWMLAASALVMVMTPGLGFFYGGLVGEKNVLNTMLMCLVSIAIVSVAWVLFGYSLAFGPGNLGIGGGSWVGLQEVGRKPSPVYGTNVPHYIYVAFQCMFAQIAPALISGAIIGRMTFMSYCAYTLIWSVCVYSTIAHWVWSAGLDNNGNVVPTGWLNSMGSIDFAGGTVIHIAAGFSGLAAAKVVGRRKDSDSTPHNVPMVMQGAWLLWFGWFGFNAGSAGSAGGVAGMAFMNTHIATSSAVLTWLFIETIHKGTQTPVGAAVAMVVGLVAITPGCGYVTPMASIAFGVVPAIACYITIEYKDVLGADDALDAFACHGVGGVMGCILTGFFADSAVNGVNGAFYGRPVLVGYQILAATVVAAFCFCATVVILLALKHTIGIRVSEELEASGMDNAHGVANYVSEAKRMRHVYAPKDSNDPFAIMFTDIQSSSKLWERASTQMPQAIELHHACIRSSILACKGYEVKTIGDSFMVCFSDVTSAIKCAVMIQDGLYNTDWVTKIFDEIYAEDDCPMTEEDLETLPSTAVDIDGETRCSSRGSVWNGLRVRIGVHYGLGSVQHDEVLQRYDYYGTVVNTAARVKSLACGGQVLVTSDAWYAADRAELSDLISESKGAHELRGLKHSMELFQLSSRKLSYRYFERNKGLTDSSASSLNQSTSSIASPITVTASKPSSAFEEK